MNGWNGGAIALALLGIAACVGLLWGCGEEEPFQPTAMSSSNQSGSFQQAHRYARGAASGAADEGMAEVVDPVKEEQLRVYLDQIQGAGAATRKDVLMSGLSSPDQTIRLTALNELEPMLAWNAQARSELEVLLRYETDPGMRRRMENLLDKEVDPILQPTAAYAVEQ
jgi:hypothetical protein